MTTQRFGKSAVPLPQLASDQDSDSRRYRRWSNLSRRWPHSPEMCTMVNWHWRDPPVLFPIFLVLLIVGYALLRTPV
jgi:hypothetical protein